MNNHLLTIPTCIIPCTAAVKQRMQPLYPRIEATLPAWQIHLLLVEQDLDAQFAIMDHAIDCSDEYYLVWDMTEIPTGAISLVDIASGKPYIGNHHHFVINTQIMREIIADINADDSIPGTDHHAKICHKLSLTHTSFSILDMYQKYCALKHPDVYVPRSIEVFEEGARYFKIEAISNADFTWLSSDYQSIVFAEGQEIKPYCEELFSNPYYQERLRPKQMLEVVEQSSSEADESQGSAYENPYAAAEAAITVESRLKYLTPDTYRFYEQLGDSLVDTNINQAYLCYENAEYLCDDEARKRDLTAKKLLLQDSGLVKVRKAAFIILSYNNTYLMQRCIESIYTNCNPDSYQLVIFDNNSSDGVAKWLADWGEMHDEAMIILSEENLGFSGGCNEACRYLTGDEDVFFLNNDVRVPANALFWLRMGLYESEEIGAVGSVQNYYDNSREENVNFTVVEQYMEYGARKNVYMENALEEQSKLCGFAILVRRDVWDQTEGFDERFNPGYLEDDDLSLQIRALGYKMMMVHNSFIYHAGSQSFIQRNDLDELNIAHRNLIVSKWGFDSAIAAATVGQQHEFIDSLADHGYTHDSTFSVLHIGCGCANMLGHIHYLYPNATLYGVEDNDQIRAFAISCINVVKDISELPMQPDEFDHVLVEP